MRIIFGIGLIFSLQHIYGEVETKELKRDFIRIEREAKKSSGFYYGLKEKVKFKRYQIQSCQFLYEKGLGEHPKDNREFAYERFMISFSGLDKSGVSSFDSVLYGHSAFTPGFKRIDFTKSFDFLSLKRVEVEGEKNLGQLKAVRNGAGELFMTFQHREVFDSTRSSFFEKGEQRDYLVKVHFSQFDPTIIKLQKVTVETYKSINGKGRKKIVDVNCNEFVEPEI